MDALMCNMWKEAEPEVQRKVYGKTRTPAANSLGELALSGWRPSLLSLEAIAIGLLPKVDSLHHRGRARSCTTVVHLYSGVVCDVPSLKDQANIIRVLAVSVDRFDAALVIAKHHLFGTSQVTSCVFAVQARGGGKGVHVDI